MRLLLFAIFLTTQYTATAQTDWALKRNEDGIKIYSGTVAGTNIKAIRLQCILDATLSELTAMLMDADAHVKWIYSTKESHEVKRIAENEQVYYSEMSMPFPFDNRDMVMHLKLTQNPANHIMTVTGNAVEEYVPLKNGKVRVKMAKVKWIVTPLTNHKLQIDYTANVDPAGSISAWIVNMFITKGPYESFKNIKTLVKESKYKNQKFNFLVEG